MRGTLFVLTLALALTAFAPVARAQGGNEPAAAAMEAAASALWDQAEKEPDATKKRAGFANAAKTYEDANRLNARFERIRSAASAWKNAGDDGRAADALEDALAQAPPAADRLEIERLLSLLDQSLGRVEINGPQQSRLLLRDRERSLPVTVRLPPGDVSLVIKLSDGSAITRPARVDAGQLVRLDVTLPGAPQTLPREPGPTPMAERGGPSGLLIGGVTLLSVGAAGGIVTAVLTGFGYSADDDADEASLSDPSIQRAIDFQRAAWGTGVPSATIGAVGAIMLIVDAASPSGSVAAVPCAGPVPWSFAVCGRF